MNINLSLLHTAFVNAPEMRVYSLDRVCIRIDGELRNAGFRLLGVSTSFFVHRYSITLNLTITNPEIRRPRRNHIATPTN